MHCVFCGAKQAAAAAPQPNANAKTVLGYSAADLLKQAGMQQPQQPFQPPQAPQFTPPQQQFQPPQPQAPQFTPPQQFQPPPQPFQPPQQFQPPPQPFQPPQQFQPPQPPPFAPPPAQAGFGGSATAATMFMQNAPQIPVQPAQPMPAPQPYPAPQQFQPPAPQPFQPQPMGGMGGMGGMPAPQPYQPPQPQPYNPIPVGAPGQPPFLASQTAARMNKPIEPYNDTTKMVLLIFGACLLAAFVVPVSFSPLKMMVTSIGDMGGTAILAPIFVGLGGVAGILLALSPMPGLQRGLFAAALGLVPILCFATFVMGGFDWHTLVYPAGGILVPTGLLLRDKYPSDNLPRLFIIIGAACIAVPFFLPFRVVDLVLGIFKALVHPGQLVALLGGFIPLVLAAFALILAMLPGQAKLGAKQLAWLWFLFPPALAIAQATADGSIVHTLTNGPGGLFMWVGGGAPAASAVAQVQAAANAASGAADAAGAAAALQTAAAAPSTFALPLFTAFAAFATFGLATLFGKQLEQTK